MHGLHSWLKKVHLEDQKWTHSQATWPRRGSTVKKHSEFSQVTDLYFSLFPSELLLLHRLSITFLVRLGLGLMKAPRHSSVNNTRLCSHNNFNLFKHSPSKIIIETVIIDTVHDLFVSASALIAFLIRLVYCVIIKSWRLTNEILLTKALRVYCCPLHFLFLMDNWLPSSAGPALHMGFLLGC